LLHADVRSHGTWADAHAFHARSFRSEYAGFGVLDHDALLDGQLHLLRGTEESVAFFAAF